MIPKWIKCILEWLYPSRARCLGCGDERGCEREFLCEECIQMLQTSNVVAGRSEWRRRGIESIAFVYYYGRPVTGLIHAFKFRGVRSLASSLATPMIRLFRERFDQEYDYIIPIPLHPVRLRERGYNQAQLLAEKLADACGVAMRTDIVMRRRNTRQQSKLSAEKRTRNLSEAFVVKEDLAGKSILLVDDVITTGNTICACASALKAAGAREVRAISAAGTRYCHTGIKHTYRKKKA